MKEHIHTIPVLDALREPGHCPFCTIRQKLDKEAVDFVMGPAYMDEDIRDKTNEAGFCEDHLLKIYGVQNRLGAALLIHTHLKQLMKDTEFSGRQSRGFFKKSDSPSAKAGGHIAAMQSRCYICEKIDGTFKRYMSTFFYMWPKDLEIRPLVETVPGFCMPHYGMMLDAAEANLSKKQLEEFLAVVVPLQRRALEKIEGDLSWFIQKFDYRNADASWKDSKDSIQRAMAMLKGMDVE